MYQVKLTYFKPSGKYYSGGEYRTEKSDLIDIWIEVRQMRDGGTLPGLCGGHSPFIVSVDVPGHPHEHPKLIV